MHGGANVQLGPDWINIHGSADLTISYLDSDGKGSLGDGQSETGRSPGA